MLVAVFVSNIPESIAASASLLNSGWSLARLYVLWAAIAIASALAAGIGYAMLDGASPRTLAFILAFAGGAILTMLATSMMPEAYEHAGRAVGIVTVLGFFLAFAIHWAQA
jgi:zinc transporter, ZIP family